ncbi:hypothetical protein H310_05848 [Aphanomyces invadans]|uniref:Uncharacterized protein n=1 Tax=Aphanomyces invadans TaxID=157072 RepID=A0A024U7V6_9STRA|nr:hypothetical protein H310_05848 [Aphanomyces invadans]ETW02300.1 hypothetical protein H310_05848 [Aphanomyces invadans]|eukprot:XP_008868905.1 hypothetical protein H310_05848 [Aphanomyces invadans]
MGPPKTDNLAKNLLARHAERQRFDSADWAMSLPMNTSLGKEVAVAPHDAGSPRADTPLHEQGDTASMSFTALATSPGPTKPTSPMPSSPQPAKSSSPSATTSP